MGTDEQEKEVVKKVEVEKVELVEKAKGDALYQSTLRSTPTRIDY